VDLEAADEEIGEPEHQHRDAEPDQAERDERDGQGEQPQERLENRVQDPEQQRSLDQVAGRVDLDAAEHGHDDPQHDGVGDPGEDELFGEADHRL
jgi:hypothetical protein